jgi:hypothetical protein
MSTLLYTSEGWMDLEEQYIPGCVAAEMPDGRAEAMRAIAVAARTYVLCRIDEDAALGTEAKPIPNHARFQVFQRNAPASVREVVITTRTIVCRHEGRLVLCNHVLGAPWDSAGKPQQPDLTDTEQWVTYNSGKTAAAVRPSPISNIQRPDNRGCMSDHGADWLARQGYKYASILRYFYGADLYIAPFDVPPPLRGGEGQTPQPPPAQPFPSGAPTMPAGVPATPDATPAKSSSSPLPILALAALALLKKGGF